MKFSVLLATCGKGWAGSSPTGISSGRTSRSKKRATQAFWAGVRSAWLMISMPWRRRAGITSVLKMRYCSSARACARRGGRHIPPGRLTAGRTRGIQHVGKAHLEELVQVGRDDGDVAQPLQQRHVRTLGLGQHPAVEGEDGQFAVEQRRHRDSGRLGLGDFGHAPSL
jgi:hypothetical protein